MSAAHLTYFFSPVTITEFHHQTSLENTIYHTCNIISAVFTHHVLQLWQADKACLEMKVNIFKSWILDPSYVILVCFSDHSLNVTFLAPSNCCWILGNNIIFEQASLQARCDLEVKPCLPRNRSLLLSGFSHRTVENKVYSVAVYLGLGLLALMTDVLGKGQPGEWLERYPGSR